MQHQRLFYGLGSTLRSAELTFIDPSLVDDCWTRGRMRK